MYLMWAEFRISGAAPFEKEREEIKKKVSTSDIEERINNNATDLSLVLLPRRRGNSF